jgi:NAD(P)-dependent dehydrogenase (short-subunit alcohol dehydrogenase family)
MLADAAAPFPLRTVLLSGVSGALGAEVARQLVDGRVRVGAIVRKPWQVAKIAGALGDSALVGCVPSDDGEAAAGFVKGIEDALGPIDAFLSCSGAFACAPAGEDKAGLAGELFEANTLSVLNVVRAVVPPMKRRRAGALVFTGAAAAEDLLRNRDTAPAMSLYLAAKSALHGYARALAAELAGSGIRVALIAPGILDTPANRAAMPAADRSSWQDLASVARALIRAARARQAEPIVLFDRA